MKKAFLERCRVEKASMKPTEQQVKDCFDHYQKDFIELFQYFHVKDRFEYEKFVQQRNWMEHLYQQALKAKTPIYDREKKTRQKSCLCTK